MSGRDARQQPTWSDTDPVNLAIDLTAVGKVSEYGPTRVGTSAEREASAAYAGCRWWDTSDDAEYIYDGDSWKSVRQAATITATNVVTVGQGWNRWLAVGTWSTDDPHGLITVSTGGTITFQKAGVYRLQAEVHLNYGSGNRTAMMAFYGAADTASNLPNSAEAWTTLGAYEGANGGQLVMTRRMGAGSLIAPWSYMSSATQRQAASKNIIHVERLSD